MPAFRRLQRRPERPYSGGFMSEQQPAGFKPTQLAGCVLWLRADLGITLGTGVSAWADQSGTGDSNKNCSQATGSKQPTLNATDAAFNHQPTLSFAAASAQALVSGTWAASLSQPATIFIVGLDDGSNSDEFYLDGNASPHRFVIDKTNSTQYEFYAGGSIFASSVTTGVPAVFAALFNGASSLGFLSAKTAVVSGNAGSNNLTGTAIGSAFDGATDPLNGKVAEVIIYNSDIGSTNRSKVWSYLGARYGIAIGS